jgi:hypothetical protein
MICLECIAAQNMHRITIKGIRIPGSYSKTNPGWISKVCSDRRKELQKQS